jgi:hypothetical protein
MWSFRELRRCAYYLVESRRKMRESILETAQRMIRDYGDIGDYCFHNMRAWESQRLAHAVLEAFAEELDLDSYGHDGPGLYE